MKVMLTIGSGQWVCESASKAAKIADLLGDCTPVKQIFDAGSDPHVYLEKRDYTHDVRIKEITPKVLLTASEAKVKQLIEAHSKIPEKVKL
jgi:hypothetical protein